MFEKYKKKKRTRCLKQYWKSVVWNNSLHSCDYDHLFLLLSGLMEVNKARALIKLLDDDSYVCLWSCLLDLKDKHPALFD